MWLVSEGPDCPDGAAGIHRSLWAAYPRWTLPLRYTQGQGPPVAIFVAPRRGARILHSCNFCIPVISTLFQFLHSFSFCTLAVFVSLQFVHSRKSCILAHFHAPTRFAAHHGNTNSSLRLELHSKERINIPRNYARRTTCSAARERATNSRTFSASLRPGAASTPLATSTPQGRSVAMASATFCAFMPPAAISGFRA